MTEAIARDGVRLRYSIAGPADAAPLLLCHSLGTSIDLWAPQVDEWARRYRVIRYDARGHGRSEVPPGECTLDDLGHDALAVLDACGAPAAAHIAGVSIGGQTALWLGVNAPARVRSLVVANTAARLGSQQRWTDRIALVSRQGLPAIVDAAVAVWFTPDFIAREREQVESFRRILLGCSQQGYIACCAALRDADLQTRLASVRAPTLVIAGRHDTAATPADAEYLIAQIAGARGHVLDAAHLSNVERPREFASAVAAFWQAM